MDYYLFIDETGTPHSNIDPKFPVFTLCGTILSEGDYKIFGSQLDTIKAGIWGTKKIVLHSASIAVKRNEFAIFADTTLFNTFIRNMNQLITNTDFSVLSCTFRKDSYAPHTYPNVHRVYSICLECIIERTIHFLRRVNKSTKINLRVIVERRGKKEDKILESAFNLLLAQGNKYWNAREFKEFTPDINFRYKVDNVNGLQLADACAFPIARWHLEPHRQHPTFPYIEPKIYCFEGNCKSYGLKVYP